MKGNHIKKQKEVKKEGKEHKIRRIKKQAADCKTR
jgi:hypothetical protein